jgi:hypothetical protein
LQASQFNNQQDPTAGDENINPSSDSPPKPATPPTPPPPFPESPIDPCSSGPLLPPTQPPISVPSASDLPERRYASITTPFELFYGEKPDYRVLFKWGSVGYYRRCADSGIDCGNFDAQSNIELALGRSNQTNAMIFWDPATSRMNVSADYRLDPTGSITSSYPNIVYDGHISPLVLRGGGMNADKEPFPPGSSVTVLHEGEHLPGKVLSVPLSDQTNYTVVLHDSPVHYLVPMDQLTGEGEPVFGTRPPSVLCSTHHAGVDSTRSHACYHPPRRPSTSRNATIHRSRVDLHSTHGKWKNDLHPRHGRSPSVLGRAHYRRLSRARLVSPS